MSNVFQSTYAGSYDTVYGEKDYAGECDAVAKLIARNAGDGRRLLDLGCGTGRHAVLMSERGFDVTGVDRSESMLEHARTRAQALPRSSKITFVQGDIRTFATETRFDVAVMMFNVLGYMTTNDDLLAALGAARRSVRDGGLLVADFWYGPSVAADPPGDRLKTMQVPSGRIIRMSSGKHLVSQQGLEISIAVLEMEGDRLVRETTEVHRMRYFYPLELDLVLRTCGFRLVSLTGFPDVDTIPNSADWNAALVAVAGERAAESNSAGA